MEPDIKKSVEKILAAARAGLIKFHPPYCTLKDLAKALKPPPSVGKTEVMWGWLRDRLNEPGVPFVLIVAPRGMLRWWLTRLTVWFPGHWSEMTDTWTLPDGRAVRFQFQE